MSVKRLNSHKHHCSNSNSPESKKWLMMFVAFGGRLNWVGCILVDSFRNLATLACFSCLTNFSLKRNADIWREIYIREIYGILHQVLCTVFVWPTVQWKITCKHSRQSCQSCAVRWETYFISRISWSCFRLSWRRLLRCLSRSCSDCWVEVRCSLVVSNSCRVFSKAPTSSSNYLTETYKHTFKPIRPFEI